MSHSANGIYDEARWQHDYDVYVCARAYGRVYSILTISTTHIHSYAEYVWNDLLDLANRQRTHNSSGDNSARV